MFLWCFYFFISFSFVGLLQEAIKHPQLDLSTRVQASHGAPWTFKHTHVAEGKLPARLRNERVQINKQRLSFSCQGHWWASAPLMVKTPSNLEELQRCSGLVRRRVWEPLQLVAQRTTVSIVLLVFVPVCAKWNYGCIQNKTGTFGNLSGKQFVRGALVSSCVTRAESWVEKMPFFEFAEICFWFFEANFGVTNEKLFVKYKHFCVVHLMRTKSLFSLWNIKPAARGDETNLLQTNGLWTDKQGKGRRWSDCAIIQIKLSQQSPI